MTLPASIQAEFVNLQAQVKAAGALNAAPHATVQAIKLNAAQLVSDVQAALVASNSLDNWVAPADPIAMISGVLAVAQAADDQSDLSLARGVAGRALSNLNQVTA
jgi:hypothetical protein